MPQRNIKEALDSEAIRSPRLLTIPQTAEFLQVSKSCLNKWRSGGGGPIFIRLAGGSIRYRLSDLVAFIEARAHSSTSTYAA